MQPLRHASADKAALQQTTDATAPAPVRRVALRRVVRACVLPFAALALLRRSTSGSSGVFSPAAAAAAPLRWTTCPDDYPPRLQCGRLDVPLDHQHPDCGSISLGMVRIRANVSAPLGNLIINSGGPGSSPVAILRRGDDRKLVGDDLKHHFNVIVPDPRGVGTSSPVQCDANLFNRHVNRYVDSLTGFDELVAWSRAFGASCKVRTGPLLEHLDTVAAAKDMDLIRQALGDEKLDFLAYSYGSQLGSQYAELFPDRVGRMLLNGVLDHSQNQIDGLLTEALTTENSWKGFIRWCARSHTACALDGLDIASLVRRLVDEANRTPIPAPGCRSAEVVAEAASKDSSFTSSSSPPAPLPSPSSSSSSSAPSPSSPLLRACLPDVTGSELLDNAQELLFMPPQWPALAQALLAASRGNATQLSEPVAPIAHPRGYSAFSHAAISCQDWLRTDRGSDLLARLTAARALAPLSRGINEMLEIQTVCLGWPAPVTNPQRKLERARLARAPPILLVNSLHDPSTSVAWAIGLRKQMPSAVSVFRDGYGHTSYWYHGETQRAIDAFFIHGIMPADLTVYTT